MPTKILYIQPTESFGDMRFLSESFLRISNYLNSRIDELQDIIKEEYLDLRFENLPLFCPETILQFRMALKNLLLKIYKSFEFNIAAICCYTSFTYLNSIEVAWMIKKFINPNCYIIVGGFHPSVKSKDFFSEKIPNFFRNYSHSKATPFDALIIDEGEIPFFHIIQNIMNGTLKMRKDLSKNPIVLEREILEDLNELPLIDLNLFKKYKNAINQKGEFYLSFNRGCLYRCKFCSSSKTSKMKSYRNVRLKSVDKCISEIKKIINTKWLKLEKLMINDPILFPQRSQKELFLKELEKLLIQNHIPFRIYIHDRMELCSDSDLMLYKKLNIIPGFGLETGSPTLLCRLGKFLGKNNNLKNAKEYLKLTEHFIKKSNELDTPIVFLCMGVTPGVDKNTIEEEKAFFFGKRFSDGKSLIDKYKINLQIQKFGLLPGNTFYDQGERIFDTKYHFKEWYRTIFEKEQALYSTIFETSKELAFTDAMNYLIGFLGKLYKSQIKLKNPFYNLSEYIYHRKLYDKILEIYNTRIFTSKKEIKLQTASSSL